MTGQEFEHFMADLLRAAGYKVDIVGGAGDQGVDLLVKEGRKLIAVQCKKHGRPVGNAAVSAVYAGAKHYGAKEAWLVAPEGFYQGRDRTGQEYRRSDDRTQGDRGPTAGRVSQRPRTNYADGYLGDAWAP